MSDLTFQELKKRIDNNNNRSTVKPYLLLLREKRKYVAHDEYNHDSEEVYVDLTGDYYQTKTLEEMVQFYKESVGSEEEFNETYPDGLIEDKHYSIHQMGSYQYTVNIFLTDKGYQDHMELNRHNVGEHDTFGIHAFRNPEISKMFEAIERVVELEEQLAKKDEIIKELKRLYFYADPEIYIMRDRNGWQEARPERLETIADYHHPNTDWKGSVRVGGRLAREVKKKIEELENE